MASVRHRTQCMAIRAAPFAGHVDRRHRPGCIAASSRGDLCADEKKRAGFFNEEHAGCFVEARNGVCRGPAQSRSERRELLGHGFQHVFPGLTTDGQPPPLAARSGSPDGGGREHPDWLGEQAVESISLFRERSRGTDLDK